MNNFTLGKYMPLKSVVHRMDPRAKLIAMLVMLVALFIPSGYIGYVVIAIMTLFLIGLAKLNLSFVFKAMRPMMFMLAFLFVINAFVIKTGYIMLTIASFELYSDAVFQTLYIVVRLMLMVMITTLLTASTKPFDLTLGLEDLMSPLKKVKVPASEIAMMISIALRFIPTLIEETQRIMQAQASRGVDLQEGNIKEKIMAILSLIVPLFVSAFQRAEELANAMEARGYVPGAFRTRYKQLKFEGRDYALIIGSNVILIGLIVIAVLL